jgi:hypothetical protein
MKARAPSGGALFLALSAPLVWPPSTIAQQFPHTPATVNLGPTINLAFRDIASLRSHKLPFNPETKQSQNHAQVKFLPCKRKLRQQPFAGPDSTRLTNAALRMKLVGTSPVARSTGSSTSMMVGRFAVAHASPAESHRTEHLPTLYREDTPFSTQVRMPVANLWGGRLQLDGFYREVSTNRMLRGLAQSSDPPRANPVGSLPHSDTAYGIALSFHKPILRAKTPEAARVLVQRLGTNKGVLLGPSAQGEGRDYPSRLNGN